MSESVGVPSSIPPFQHPWNDVVYGRPLSWQHRLNYGSHSNDLMIPQDLRRTTGTLQRHHQASEQFYIPKIDIFTIPLASLFGARRGIYASSVKRNGVKASQTAWPFIYNVCHGQSF